MFKLLKSLFSTEDGARTVVVLNDDGSKPSSSHRLHPINLWLFCLGIIGGTVLAVVLLIYFTPLGGMVHNQRDVRESVVAIQQKVAALQDTLQARNTQLRQIQQIMASGRDTSFTSFSSTGSGAAAQQQVPGTAAAQTDPIQRLPADAILISNMFKRAPDFPAPYPIEGTTTRLFNINSGHYGLDVAAEEGAVFQAVADGVIITQEWTLNYGYVIVAQHNDGIISVYKHAASIGNDTGESILKGDILGSIGNVGILSSGPHLHIEIWKKGIPQDPQNYLINS